MRKRWNTNGSITVEMCVIAPVFLTVMALMLAVVRWGVAVISIDNMVCDVTSRVAKYEYVYELVKEKNDSSIFDLVEVVDIGNIKEYALNKLKDKDLRGDISLEILDSPIQHDISARDKYSKYGIKYDSDNVTMVVKYKYKIVLPLFKTSVNTTHISVERCWNKGEYISAEKTVYITNTGVKYHIATCRYLRKSVIEITRKEAIEKGYTPCSVCTPDN